MKKDKRKSNLSHYILKILFNLIMVIVVFFLCAFIYDLIYKGVKISTVLFKIIFFMVAIYISTFAQAIIYEVGHLIGGLLSGYKFYYFKILSFIWIKENGKLKVKRLYMTGINITCSMILKNFKKEKIPYILYHLGGSIMNIITSFIFFRFSVLWSNIKIISVFFTILSIWGIICGILNGVPMRFGKACNYGYNLRILRKNKSALQAFLLVLKINEMESKYVRLKDMPEELFLIPTYEEMNNSYSVILGFIACCRLIDEHKFEEAQKLNNRLLKSDIEINSISRNIMICNEIYCKAILGSNKEEIDEILDKNQKKFMKSMKKYPSVLRTEYVYALLIENDKEKAEEIKSQFNKIRSTYPYKSEIESEYELMEIANNKVKV